MNKEKEIIEAVEEYMNSRVRERGYYNMLTAQSYAGDNDEVFNAEGTAAKTWRSKVYRQVYNIIDEWNRGECELPSAEELIEKLPTLEW